MAYNVLRQRVKQLGFCCPSAYFTAVLNVPTGEVALELGVHKRTARKWRAAFRAGRVSCAANRVCYRLASDPAAPNSPPGTVSLPPCSVHPELPLFSEPSGTS